MSGTASISFESNELALHDLEQGERIGVPVALLILVALFGTIVAALAPIGLAVVAIIVALGLVALIGQAFELVFFVTLMVTMIGLAVGIDYSLLIVSRFREEMDRGLGKSAAAERAGSTAGRTVLFSGVTVIIALCGMLIFRSIVIPIKAVIMNLLSVGATYGLLVLVFQKGVATDLLGFRHAQVVDVWIPLFLFSILFGLSMDYHVFLLSRIRERYDQTGNNAEAVAYGLRSIATIITGAALIMVAVFGGFASGETIINQQVGFGLAMAVLLDATLVRSVLVPASMEVLGNRNWYLPSFLRWLPDLRIEAEEE